MPVDNESRRIGPIVPLVGIGLAGWAAYEFWYKPEQEKKAALARAAVQYQQRNGGSLNDALGQVGSMVCQGAGMSYGIPPQLSAGICAELGPLSAQLVRGAPKIVTGTVKGVYTGTRAVTKDVYKGVKTVVKDVLSAPVSIGKTIFKGFKSIF